MRRLLVARVPALRQQALRRGLFGGDNRWLAVWGALATARLAKRILTPKPVVARFVLGPGETIQVSDLGLPGSEGAAPAS